MLDLVDARAHEARKLEEGDAGLTGAQEQSLHIVIFVMVSKIA